MRRTSEGCRARCLLFVADLRGSSIRLQPEQFLEVHRIAFGSQLLRTPLFASITAFEENGMSSARSRAAGPRSPSGRSAPCNPQRRRASGDCTRSPDPNGAHCSSSSVADGRRQAFAHMLRGRRLEHLFPEALGVASGPYSRKTALGPWQWNCSEGSPAPPVLSRHIRRQEPLITGIPTNTLP